jgi:cytosine/uracil/thiamine/allantoin permease
MDASGFDPRNPRDARAFAEGVMAAQRDSRARIEQQQHHTEQAEEAKRHLGWLVLCAMLFLTTAFNAESWAIGLASFVLGLGIAGAVVAKIVSWHRHATEARNYEPEAGK